MPHCRCTGANIALLLLDFRKPWPEYAKQGLTATRWQDDKYKSKKQSDMISKASDNFCYKEMLTYLCTKAVHMHVIGG